MVPEKTPAASPTMLSAVVVAEADEDESREYSMGSGCSDDASSATEEERRLQLADSLSASYPGMSLSAALHNMAAGPGVVGGSRTEDDPLSNSCYAAIRLERGPLDDEEEDDDNDVPLQLPDTTMPCQLAGRDTTVDGDDDLTSLAWLQDSNLLKNIGGKGRLCPSPPADVTDDDEDEAGGEGKENGAGSKICATVTASTLHPQQHPSHIPYNPLKHVNSKPPYSFSCLIFMAIEDAPDKRLPVKDIYSWILSHFPYFQSAPTGWKNSVRHNLSLNKCFKKVDKDKGSNIGKGSYWCIDPEFRPNLLQALRKTPYHPYHQLQMMSSSVMPGVNGPMKLPLAPRVNGATVSPHLFPFLSRRLAQSGHAIPSASTSSSDLTSDIEVANALVSLKSPSFISSSPHHQARSKAPTGGVRSRSPSPPEFGSEADRRRKAVATRRRRGNPPSPVVITEVPSEDHTYIASTSANAHGSSPASSSIDGEYEFGCRRHGSGHNEDDSCHSEHTDYDDEDRDASNYDDEDAEDEFDSEEDEEEMEVDGCVDHLPASQSPEVVHGKEIDGIDALLNLASIATSVMENAFREEVVM